MKKLLLTYILIMVSIGNLYCQEKIIKGIVVAENLERLPFASIMINDTIEIGKADVNGYFQIKIPISEQKLMFVFLGLEATYIGLDDNCNEVEVIMMDATTYDFMTLKKADRLRRKRFKKLPELRKKAFKTELFKSDKSCYCQEFIPYFKKKLK